MGKVRRCLEHLVHSLATNFFIIIRRNIEAERQFTILPKTVSSMGGPCEPPRPRTRTICSRCCMSYRWDACARDPEILRRRRLESRALYYRSVATVVSREGRKLWRIDVAGAASCTRSPTNLHTERRRKQSSTQERKRGRVHKFMRAGW
jgi:hypothetical protein